MKLIETQKRLLGGPAACSPGKFLKFTCCNGYFSASLIIFTQILLKFLDRNSECFAKYDAFCSHVFDVHVKGVRLMAMEEVRNYGKTFLKMAGGRMHTPHSTYLAISYKNHQKSVAYFSQLAPLILLFFTEMQNQKGSHGTMLPLNTL